MHYKSNFFKIAPEAMKHMTEMEAYFREQSTLDPILIELIKTRVSQINGCAFCLNSHTKSALSLGESQHRLFLLNAWWETAEFTDKEKAALALAEHLTLVVDKGAPVSMLNTVKEHFTEKEFVDLVLIINQINSWNRLNISVHNDI